MPKALKTQSSRSGNRPGSALFALSGTALSALLLAGSGAMLFSGCSSDAAGIVIGGEDPDPEGFAVLGTSVVNGSTWQLNRAISVEFTQDIDFSTVSLSTIQLVDTQGTPAVGTFTLETPRIVVFQPKCPTNNTNSDGGLLQGRNYRLSVLSENSPGLGGGVTVQSTAGDRLTTGLNVEFETPESTDPLVLFVDVVSGPPQVRVQGLNGEPSDSQDASYVEFGNDPNNREFLRFSPLNQQGEIESEVPLNLYSDSTQQFSVVLQFNQPIFASSLNVNSDLIRLEYLNPGTGTWLRVPADVALVANCTATGASVRVTPSGVVPQGSDMRIALREGFRDLTGDRVQSTQTNFARFTSTVANPTGGTALERSQGSDEILERFTVGGNLPGSLEDTTLASAQPRADWANANSPGALSGSFNFSGTGGVGGTFDFVVRLGETIFINTDSDNIEGGPGVIQGGSPTATQPVINGVIDVRNFMVEQGGRLVFIGPNTATILATGTVVIEGDVSLNGGDNFGVGTLNTTNQPEEGAAGQAGGGSGGVGSFLTSQSTERGGAGNGAFEVPGIGGGGGETSFAPGGSCGKNNRRGAGGGGGVFGPPIIYNVGGNAGNPAICQMLIGMDAEPGFTGSLDGTGAVSMTGPAEGGTVAPSPFTDASPNNNFFGTMLTSTGDQITGELPSVWAGSGGGAGGDAVTSPTFPRTPFNAAGDEKGSGGGGGGGGLLVLAIGNIELNGLGTLTADGGHGGGGENVIFFDRIGGGSGGGSGGHIVMSSAAAIIIESEVNGPATGSFYDDATGPAGAVHERRPLRALGGQGGSGRDDRCGADQEGETTWRADAVPPSAFTGLTGTPIPPQGEAAWLNCNRIDACAATEPEEGIVLAGGGDGGPGIIQLHVADPATQLLFPSADPLGDYTVGIDVSRSMAPPPTGWSDPDSAPDVLIPFFSSRSESFSRWIPLGLARLNSDGTTNPVEFFFDGTDVLTGDVIRDNSLTQELAAVFPFTGVSFGGATPSLDGQAATVTVSGAAFADPNDLYKRNARLLREFAVRIREVGAADNGTEYTVVDASYDVALDEFTVSFDPRGTVLADQLLNIATAEVEIVPFFFRFLTSGVQDSFPLNTGVTVAFDATVADALTGEPSSIAADSFSQGVISDFATDISDITNAPTNQGVGYDFIRFKVEFDLATNPAMGVDLDSPRPGIDFLRIPYRF